MNEISWRRIMVDFHGCVADRLPEDLLLQLLSWLPDRRCVGCCRTVCRKWSRLLKSEYFVKVWNATAAAKGQRPCLLLASANSSAMPGELLYDFSSRKWQALKMFDHGLTLPPGGANLKGSFGGLLLLEVPFGGPAVFQICDPSKGSCQSLPPLNSICSVMASTITGSLKGERDEYVVVAGGRNSRSTEFVVEIYESSTKMWNVVETLSLPEGMAVSLRNDEIVVWNNFVIFTTLKPFSGLLLYGLRSRSCSFVSMPAHVGADANLLNARLLRVESERVFLVVSLEIVGNTEVPVNEICIWEFEMNSETWGWKEVGKMPQEVLQKFFKLSNSSSKWVECVEVGQHLCFRSHGSLQVLTYNLRNCTWDWLPTVEHEYPDHKHNFLKMMAHDTFSHLQLQ